MSMTLTRTGSVVHATLSGALCVPDAATLHRELTAALDPETSLVVDAKAVSRLDASIAQLFLFVSGGVREFRVEDASPAWRDAWCVLGLPRSPKAV